MEQSQLHQRGKGATGAALSQILTEVAQQPVATFYCPSRRQPQAYINADPGAPNANFGDPPTLARIDYAANLGPRTQGLPGDPGVPITPYFTVWGPGPVSVADAAVESNFVGSKFDQFKYNQGVVFQRSEINFKHITDGTSNTWMIGEKNIDPTWYDGGSAQNFALKDIGDDQGAWVSDDRDTCRNTGDDMRSPAYKPDALPPRPDQIRDVLTDPEKNSFARTFTFGSAHPATFQMAMCDASVRGVSYEIDPHAFNQQGTRAGDEIPATGQ
jgi:hypothetical protein